MIQEILEYYFDKKVTDLLNNFVTREDFKERLSVKLDYSTFRDYEKMVASDRTQELKNFSYDEKIFNLQKNMNLYVTKEDFNFEMSDKVTSKMLEPMQETLYKLQEIQITQDENLKQKILVLKDELEEKTQDLIHKIEDVDRKVEELAEEAGSYDEEDDESDQDLDSELGDTLDVNDMKYPNVEKDRSSGDEHIPDKQPAIKRLSSQASDNYEKAHESITEDSGADSSPSHKRVKYEGRLPAQNPSEMALDHGPLTPNNEVAPGVKSPPAISTPKKN